MALTDQTYTLIKPFTGIVAANGVGECVIVQSLHGIIWQIFQIGFALNQTAFNPQAGAHFNGMPLTSAVAFQKVSFPGVPYAMETFFVGPPYIGIKAGDQIVCTVTSATAGDTFTAAAYISEEVDPSQAPVAPSSAPPGYTRWR